MSINTGTQLVDKLNTWDTLKRLTPAVFATEPHPDVSNKYEFMPSLPIVENLLSHGWSIRSAKQNLKGDQFSSHQIVFDVPGAPRKREVDDVWPTATLYNSHNRSRRLSFCCGFFRTVCSNQAQVMVFGTTESKIHILGNGAPFDIDHFRTETMGLFNRIVPMIDDLRSRELSTDERTRFGKQALSIARYYTPDNAVLYSPQDASELLTPRRQSDKTNTLWHVYNTAQERIIHGGRGGGVQEVTRNRRINLALWDNAVSYLNN